MNTCLHFYFVVLKMRAIRLEGGCVLNHYVNEIKVFLASVSFSRHVIPQDGKSNFFIMN